MKHRSHILFPLLLSLFLIACTTIPALASPPSRSIVILDLAPRIFPGDFSGDTILNSEEIDMVSPE